MNGQRGLRIASLGGFARATLESVAEAHLLGVFDRSIHIATGNAVVCIVESGLGNGPLNAVIAPLGTDQQKGGWSIRAGRPGDVACVTRHSLAIGGLDFDIADAETWRPKPWPPGPKPHELSPVLDRLAYIANRQAPADGLSRLVLCPHDRAEIRGSPVARVATPRLYELASWLRIEFAGSHLKSLAACGGGGGASPIPTNLLGLGPGLTPSGDDVLCGALVALHALGRTDTAAALGQAVTHDAAAATTQLSRAFLAAAAGGQGAEALHILLAAMLSGRVGQLDAMVADVARIGHTSGWDSLAGVALTLSAFADTAAG